MGVTDPLGKTVIYIVDRYHLAGSFQGKGFISWVWTKFVQKH